MAAELDLSRYGISNVAEVVHSPSYERLYEEETAAGLSGYEICRETETGALDVFTGVYTGRSPKDKFIVDDATAHDTVW